MCVCGGGTTAENCYTVLRAQRGPLECGSKTCQVARANEEQRRDCSQKEWRRGRRQACLPARRALGKALGVALHGGCCGAMATTTPSLLPRVLLQHHA